MILRTVYEGGEKDGRGISEKNNEARFNNLS